MLALAVAPSTWLVALVPVLAVAGHVLGLFRARFSLYAGLGLLAYVLSTLAQDAWRLGHTIELQIMWWQAGIFGSGVVYYLILWWHDERSTLWLAGAFLCMSVLCFQVPMDNVAAQKFAEAGLLAAVTALALGVFVKVPRRDFLAHTLWVVLVLYEALGFVLYLDCQIFHELMVPRALGSACDRKYESPVSWLPPVMIGLTIAYLFGRGWLNGKT